MLQLLGLYYLNAACSLWTFKKRPKKKKTPPQYKSATLVETIIKQSKMDNILATLMFQLAVDFLALI